MKSRILHSLLGILLFVLLSWLVTRFLPAWRVPSPIFTPEGLAAVKAPASATPSSMISPSDTPALTLSLETPSPPSSAPAFTPTDTLAPTPQHEAYDKLVDQFSKAIEAFKKGEFAEAKSSFDAIIGSGSDEPMMVDRSRTYVRICEQRLAPDEAEPADAEGRFYRAVLLINEGRGEDALGYIDQALQDSPTSARLLYTRASAWAIRISRKKHFSANREYMYSPPTMHCMATFPFGSCRSCSRKNRRWRSILLMNLLSD